MGANRESALSSEQYVQRVEAACADLAVQDRARLLAGLESHLGEHGSDVDLVALLGDPADYATELREAMDLPARGPDRAGVDELRAAPRPRRRLIALAAALLLLGALGTATAVLLDRTGEDGGPSSGTGQIAVPDVVGLTQEEATARLENSGFAVRSQSAGSPARAPVAAGTVVAQDPSAGRGSDLGSTVTLEISNP